MAEKLIIFISGTMRDLPTERERVAATIREMVLAATLFEGKLAGLNELGWGRKRPWWASFRE